MTDTSGRMFEMPLSLFDPDTSTWKMLSAFTPSEPPSSSTILPRSGTCRHGEVWEAPPLADAIDESDSGSLLPTPTAQAAKHSNDDRGPGTLDDFNLWSVIARLA